MKIQYIAGKLKQQASQETWCARLYRQHSRLDRNFFYLFVVRVDMAHFFRFVSLLVLAGVCLAGWIFWSMWRLTIQPEPFDIAKWKASASADYASNDPGCYRGAMALGVIESQQLIGKTHVELDALLGVPKNKMANRWFYPVGQCAGDWTHYVLVVTFDQSGGVVDAALKPES